MRPWIRAGGAGLSRGVTIAPPGQTRPARLGAGLVALRGQGPVLSPRLHAMVRPSPCRQVAAAEGLPGVKRLPRRPPGIRGTAGLTAKNSLRRCAASDWAFGEVASTRDPASSTASSPGHRAFPSGGLGQRSTPPSGRGNRRQGVVAASLGPRFASVPRACRAVCSRRGAGHDQAADPFELGGSPLSDCLVVELGG